MDFIYRHSHAIRLPGFYPAAFSAPVYNVALILFDDAHLLRAITIHVEDDATAAHPPDPDRLPAILSALYQGAGI